MSHRTLFVGVVGAAVILAVVFVWEPIGRSTGPLEDVEAARPGEVEGAPLATLRDLPEEPAPRAHSGARVVGRIRLHGGGPPTVLERLRVSLLDGDVQRTAEVDGEGGFLLAEIPVGPAYRLGIQAWNFGPHLLPVPPLVSGQTTDLGDVILDPGVTVRGRVRNMGGHGIEQALVMARHEGDRWPLHYWTDREGRFQMPLLAPGEWRVTARRQGYYDEAEQVVRVELARPVGDLDLVVPPGYRLGGIVHGADGLPIIGAKVRVERLSKKNPNEQERVERGLTDESGTFLFEDLPRGSYFVLVTDGVSSARIEQTPAGQEDLHLVLDASGLLAGHVILTDGAPAVNALVKVTEGRKLVGALRSCARREPTRPGGFNSSASRRVGTASRLRLWYRYLTDWGASTRPSLEGSSTTSRVA